MTDLAIATPLLRNDGYLKLWLIGLFCGVIRWMELLAFGLFAIDTTGSPALVALLVMLRLLPMALFGVIIGAVSDLISPYRLLLISLVAIGSFAGLTLIAIIGTTPPFWLIALGAFLSGTFWASDLPVRRKMAADLVAPRQLASAMALDGATSNGMRCIGPLTGGFLYQSFGIEGVFALGTACYAISLVLALLMRPTHAPTQPAPMAPLSQAFQGSKEALSYALKHRDVARILLVTIAFNLWGFPYLAMIPVISADDLGLSPGIIGALTAIEGLLAFSGSLLLMRIARPHWFRRIYYFSNVFLLAIIATMGLVPTLPTLIIGLAVGGLCAAGFAAMQSTLIYTVAPPQMRGRFLGLMTICIGTGALGFANIGITAELFGAANALWIIGLQGIIPLALIARNWSELHKSP